MMSTRVVISFFPSVSTLSLFAFTILVHLVVGGSMCSFSLWCKCIGFVTPYVSLMSEGLITILSIIFGLFDGHCSFSCLTISNNVFLVKWWYCSM